MKFCGLVLEPYLLQNFYRQTDIFQKWSNRVQDIPKRVNPPKTGNWIFAQNQYFLLFILKKVKIFIMILRNFLSSNLELIALNEKLSLKNIFADLAVICFYFIKTLLFIRLIIFFFWRTCKKSPCIFFL